MKNETENMMESIDVAVYITICNIQLNALQSFYDEHMDWLVQKLNQLLDYNWDHEIPRQIQLNTKRVVPKPFS